MSQGKRLCLRYAPGGQRHHLDNRPIHCGDVIELRTDIGWLPVRYEAMWRGEDLEKAILVLAVPGAHMTIKCHPDAFYRWPETLTPSA